MASYTFRYEADAHATVSALRIAAERYDEDARTAERAGTADDEGRRGLHPQAAASLARQFRDQAETARRIADDLEEST